MPEAQVRGPFVVRSFAASSRWAVYADGRDLGDRIEAGEFGEDAKVLYDSTFATKGSAVGAAERLAAIVEPVLRSPFGTRLAAGGGFQVTMTYEGHRTLCGHINAKQAGKIADEVYLTQEAAEDAGRRLHTLLFETIEER